MKPSKSRNNSSSRRSRSLLVLLSMILLVQWCPPFRTEAITGLDGTLDPGFGAGGEVISSFAPFGQARAVAVQSDGKIVAGGFIGTGFGLVRYNSNGTLDTGFGPGGHVTTSINGNESVAGVAVQPDGKIVAAGSTVLPSRARRFALARFDSNGTLDPNFGAGGVVQTSFNDDDQANAVVLQSDGKVVATGFTRGAMALARYNPNGSLDPTFGAGGQVTTFFTNPADLSAGASADAVAIQSDGKIVVTGDLDDHLLPSDPFALARYNADGSLDASFGAGGKVTTSFGVQANATSLAIQPDGKIVAAGGTFGSPHQFALARYTTNGNLDANFGSAGLVTTSLSFFSGGDSSVNAMAIQADGSIVAAGSTAGTQGAVFALARYDTGGALDTSFGTGGEVTTSFNNSDDAQALAIQPDGKIVAAGGSGQSFALARYNSTGVFDTCLRDNGSGNVFQWNSKTGGYKLTICGTGFSVTGIGVPGTRGSIHTLTDFRSDRRISAAFLTNQLTGRATIYVRAAQGVWQAFTINDTSSLGEGCGC